MWTRLLSAASVLTLLVSVGCRNQPVPRITIPDQWVLAYSRPNPLSVQTVVSLDGVRWTAPRTLLDGQSPAPASAAPPGVGANNEGYMLAWFDSSGVLQSASSGDGLSWGDRQQHGTFSATILSRPSLAFHYGLRAWFVAFQDSTHVVRVMQIRPQAGSATNLAGVSTAFAPSLVFWNNQLLLLTKAADGLRIVSSQDGVSWTPGPGTLITDGSTPIASYTAPFMRSWPGGLWLATNGQNPPSSGGDRLHSGRIEVYGSGDGMTWTHERTISPAFPEGDGPAIAGPQSELVVADPGAGLSDMYLNGVRSKRIQTETDRTVSLAHGPKVAKSVSIFFDREFQRGYPERGFEDVRLEVRLKDAAGVVRETMEPWVREDAEKAAPNFWGSGTYPRFDVIATRGDVIEVTVTGDHGTVTGTIPVSSLIDGAARGASITGPLRSQVDASGPPGTLGYTVRFTFGVSDR